MSPLVREIMERTQARLAAPKSEPSGAAGPLISPELAGAKVTMEDIRSIVQMEEQTVRHLLRARALAAERGEEFDPFEPPRVKPPLPLQQTKPGLLQIALDYATRPLATVAGATKALIEGRGLYSALEEAGKGITGEQKTFMVDVLEAAGVPTLGTAEITAEQAQAMAAGEAGGFLPPLSEEEATQVVSRPTGRGVLGFIGDIFADPLTYLTLGVGRALQLGNGLFLSARGETLLAEQIAANTARGLPRNVARELSEQAVKTAVDEGAQGLLHRGGVRWAGMTIPGTPEVSQAFRTALRQSAEAVKRTEAGRKLYEGGEKAAALFSRDFLVRRYGDYVKDKQRYFDLLKADQLDIMDEAAVMFAGTGAKDRMAITRAIEGGQAAIDELPEHLQKAAIAVRASQTALRQEEIARGLGESFLDDYMLHAYTNYPAVRETGVFRSVVSPSLRSNRERIIPTLEEAKALGLKPVSEDAMDLFVLRKVASSRAQRAQDLIEETGLKFGKPERATDAEKTIKKESAIGKGISEVLEPTEESVKKFHQFRGTSPEEVIASAEAGKALPSRGMIQTRGPLDPLTYATPLPSEAIKFARLPDRSGGVIRKEGAVAEYTPNLEFVRGYIFDTETGRITGVVNPGGEKIVTEAAQVRWTPFERRIADDLVEAPNFRTETGDAILLPRRIAEDLAAIGTEGQLPAAIAPLVRGYDKAQNFWKATVTSVFPAFHARNAVTNVVNSSLDIGIQSANPIRHAETMRVLLGESGTLVNRFGEQYGYDELRRLFRTTGVEGAFGGKLELEMTAGGKLIGPDNPLFKAGRAVGEAIEDEARMHHFLASIRRGFAPEEAASKTKQFLFDYANLSSFERTVIRRAIPFYTFYRKNVPLQAKMLITEPGRQAVFLKTFASRGDPEQIERERRLWPEYVSEGLAIRVGTDKDNNPLILWGTGLPIEDLNKILAQTREGESQVGRTVARNFLGMLTPFAKVLIEESTGRDIFLNRSLDDVDRVYSVYGPIIEQMPKEMRDLLEFRKEYTRRGDARYRMNPRTLHLFRSFVMSRLYSTVGKMFDERKDAGTVFLNTLTGLRLGSIDAETQILPAIRRRAQERLESAARIEEQAERRLLFGPTVHDRIGAALNGHGEAAPVLQPSEAAPER